MWHDSRRNWLNSVDGFRYFSELTSRAHAVHLPVCPRKDTGNSRLSLLLAVFTEYLKTTGLPTGTVSRGGQRHLRTRASGFRRQGRPRSSFALPTAVGHGIDPDPGAQQQSCGCHRRRRDSNRQNRYDHAALSIGDNGSGQPCCQRRRRLRRGNCCARRFVRSVCAAGFSRAGAAPG